MGIATGAYVDERDDWDSAVARAVSEGWPYVELTAIRDDGFRKLVDRLASLPAQDFRRVSVHAPAGRLASPADTAAALVAWPVAFEIVLHPDVYREEIVLRELGPRAVFENMDVVKRFGRSVVDLREVFERFPDAGFCLDVAHVWTNDPSLALGFGLLDAFGDRLRQLHVSGIEPDGTHRTTTAADLELYGPLLDRCEHVPWLLEAELALG